MRKGIMAINAIILSVILLAMAGCTPKSYADYYSDVGETEDIMLVDYYSTTVGGNGHFEMVLRTTDDKAHVRLDVYSKEEDSEESCVSYMVPCEAVERCYEVINKYKLRKWNGMKNATSMDGVLEVCKFRDGKSYIRVTTEEMPPNGEEAMDALRGIMSEYVKDEYLIYE